jgi:hypothetical protein
MKKVILIISFLVCAIFAQAQTVIYKSIVDDALGCLTNPVVGTKYPFLQFAPISGATITTEYASSNNNVTVPVLGIGGYISWGRGTYMTDGSLDNITINGGVSISFNVGYRPTHLNYMPAEIALAYNIPFNNGNNTINPTFIYDFTNKFWALGLGTSVPITNSMLTKLKFTCLK